MVAKVHTGKLHGSPLFWWFLRNIGVRRVKNISTIKERRYYEFIFVEIRMSGMVDVTPSAFLGRKRLRMRIYKSVWCRWQTILE